MVLIEKRNKLTVDIVIANTSIKAMHEQDKGTCHKNVRTYLVWQRWQFEVSAATQLTGLTVFGPTSQLPAIVVLSKRLKSEIKIRQSKIFGITIKD